MDIIPQSQPQPHSKICNRCKLEKPISEFSIVRNNKDGLNHQCRPCESILNKQKYKRRLWEGNCTVCGKPNNTFFKRCDKCRAKKYEHRGENAGACVLCGFPYADVHHRDGNHTNNDPANLINLCPNHHRMVHWKLLTLLDR